MMDSHQTNELQLVLKALRYLRTHWWLFGLVMASVFVYKLMAYYRTPNVYQSNASILIDTAKREMYQSVMMTRSQATAANARKQNTVHLLTSNEGMERFRAMFVDYYNSEGRPLHLRSYFPNGISPPAEVFRDWVSLNWDKNSDIYYLECNASNPDSAHDVCLVYMNSVQAYYPDIGQRDAMMKREFLSRQIASLTRQLTEKEVDFTEFQRKNEEFMSFNMLNIEGNGLGQLRSRILELKQNIVANRAVKQLMINVPIEKGLPHTTYNATVQALELRLVQLQYKQHLTENTTTPEKDGRLAHIALEIENIERQLRSVKSEAKGAFIRNPIPEMSLRGKLTDLELEYRMALIRLENLEREIAQVEKKQRHFSAQRLEYERLLAELGHKKKLLSNLYQKEQETEIELSAGGAEIFRLQEPTRNQTRVSPKLSKALFSALSVSLFSMAALAALLLVLFPRLDNEAEVHKLNLPVLGKIPVLKGRPQNIGELSPFAVEYIKIMNYRILRETKDIKCPVIVITSATAGEGKSTITRFLNLVSRGTSRKTLLIDGDLITSHPNVFFGLKENASAGLKTLLQSPGSVNPRTLLMPTTHEGIWFLPRGARMEPTASPTFLKPLEQFLENVRKEFDTVYIDTPPIFSSNLTHQWAGLSDLIVLVARIYLTRPKDLVEALQTCKIFSKAPIGVALNCLPLSGQQRRASNYYYFSHRKPMKNAA
ncbi:MAG: hypothetical protein HY537_09005 [Deltaproteobacteria bacterium]|nr:hypothetical protein [Deltaproteobacteria bacterium]